MNWDIIEQVIIMALLCGVGILCRKIGLLDEHSTKKMSGIALNVAMPLVILTSYQKPFDSEMLHSLLISFLLAIVSFAASFIIIPLIVRQKNKAELAVERFSSIYSNCSFMGIPLIQGVYGDDGVFLQTAYITMFNLLSWTHGYMLMKGGKFTLKEFGKSLLSPSIIATVVGLALFLLNISLPETLLSAMHQLGNMNTPLAMLVAGSTIATVNFPKAIRKPRLYYVCFLKLIAVPAILMAFCLLFNFDPVISGVNILVCACPTAALCTMLALKFNKDAGYSTEIFAVSTILSMLTLPLMLMVYTTLAGV